MGSSQAKPKDDPWEACGPIVDDMKKKYGPEAVKFLRYWHEQFQFPANGSFSESKIEILEDKLNQHIWRTIEKKNIKRETLMLLDDMLRVLKMWKAEAERRRRKRERKKKPKDKTHSAATGGEGAAAQALENGAEEKPASLGSTDTKLHGRIQPAVSSWHSQTIPSWNMKAHPAASTVQLADNPWTINDMKENMKRLPSVTRDGEKFAKEFLVFCRVFMPTIPQVKYLVGVHLTPEQYLKIKAKTDGDGRPNDSEWDHQANVAYRVAITDLCDAIKKAFPKKVNYFRICCARQKEGETPDEFLIRLDDIFDEWSGLSRPDDYPGQNMSPYEWSLTHYFLEGLLPPIREGVETTCILLESARLEKVVWHAVHAYRYQQKAKEEVQRAPLEWNRRKRGGRGGWNRGRGWRDGCFICGSNDHWMRDCPQNTGYRSRQQGRAIGFYSDADEDYRDGGQSWSFWEID